MSASLWVVQSCWLAGWRAGLAAHSRLVCGRLRLRSCLEPKRVSARKTRSGRYCSQPASQSSTHFASPSRIGVGQGNAKVELPSEQQANCAVRAHDALRTRAPLTSQRFVLLALALSLSICFASRSRLLSSRTAKQHRIQRDAGRTRAQREHSGSHATHSACHSLGPMGQILCLPLGQRLAAGWSAGVVVAAPSARRRRCLFAGSASLLRARPRPATSEGLAAAWATGGRRKSVTASQAAGRASGH